jgi:hypothetical protein
MIRVATVLTLLLWAAFSGTVDAQNTVDLSGRWLVAWPNNTKNVMVLTQGTIAGRYSGTYESDDKTSCSTTGNYQASNRRAAFQIVCAEWDIRMQGAVAKDARTITGGYQAYVDAQGKFTMARQ